MLGRGGLVVRGLIKSSPMYSRRDGEFAHHPEGWQTSSSDLKDKKRKKPEAGQAH